MGWNQMLVCKDCEVGIEVGQDGCPLWIGDKGFLEELRDFLVKHEHHSLMYGYEGRYGDWLAEARLRRKKAKENEVL